MKPIIDLHINNQELTVEQFNVLVEFLSRFAFNNGEKSIRLIPKKFPMRLSGDAKLLSWQAKRYFKDWNDNNFIRFISAVKSDNVIKLCPNDTKEG